MRTRNIVTGLLIAGSFSFAVAQMSFSGMDANGDGVVSSDEFYKAQARNMEQRSEQNRYMKNAENAPQFADMDVNGDGKVTKDEHQNFRDKRMNENRSNRPKNGGSYGKCGGGYGQGKGGGRGYGR